MSVLAKCIKETYTWEGDGEQHKFCGVKENHVYVFDKIGSEYWIDPLLSPNKEDLIDKNGFFSGVSRGIERKYFNEMFEIV